MDTLLMSFGAGIAGALLVLIPTALYIRNLDFSEVFRKFLKSEEAKAKQTNATIARTSKEAQQLIGRDLMENSPLKSILGVLSEETVDYIMEHPEALPDVLNKWAPVITVAYPVVEKVLQTMKLGGSDAGKML